MSFVMDALACARRIKCLTYVDDFAKEYQTITAAFEISGVQVTCILDRIALFRGYPVLIRTDQDAVRRINGPLNMVWSWA